MGKKQAELAEIFGVTPDRLYTYETGKAMPNELFLDKLAQFCGISTETLKEKDVRSLPISVVEPETKSVEFVINDQQQALEAKLEALEQVVKAQAATIEALQLALKATEKS